MCNCKTWCRDWRETQDGKYPISDHAPGCEEYKTEGFTRVEHDGTSCVMEPHEAESMLDESDEEYAVSMVYLTRDQFEKLKDFAGF
jgi:hypothetical protein